MGEDKALLRFKNSTLVEYQFNKLKTIFNEVYISTKEDKFNFKAPLLLDNSEVYSPLVAFNSIFKEINQEIFILSVDTPFIDEKIVKEIYKKREFYATIAKTESQIHPLCGFYSPKIVPFIEKKLRENNHKLKSLLKEFKVKEIEFQDEKSFLNINYQKDYIEALKR